MLMCRVCVDTRCAPKDGQIVVYKGQSWCLLHYTDESERDRAIEEHEQRVREEYREAPWPS
jgi:hypothetical protein